VRLLEDSVRSLVVEKEELEKRLESQSAEATATTAKRAAGDSPRSTSNHASSTDPLSPNGLPKPQPQLLFDTPTTAVKPGGEAPVAEGWQNVFGGKAGEKQGGQGCPPSHYDLYGTYEIVSVDDNPVNQLVIENILQPCGFKVSQCMDGLEALQLLKTRAEAWSSPGNRPSDRFEGFPDLVLLDVMMPHMSGYECCKILRKLHSTTQLPVIIFSAKSGEESIVEGLDSGANDYVTKPFNRNELIARIQTLLKLKRMWDIEVEGAKRMVLLQKMLPDHIIDRLQNGEAMQLDYFPSVTILFSDVVNYTVISSTAPSEKVISMINDMFTAFDYLCDKHGVYKVETIGDSYMVVGGMDGSSDHAERVLRFGIDMLAAIKGIRVPGDASQSVSIRIGINSGPARAGVVGTKMPRYTFFGDTVNTASRMETNSFTNSIVVSDSCRRLLDGVNGVCDFYELDKRLIKGKGMMKTHLVLHDNCQSVDLVFQQLANPSSCNSSIECSMLGGPSRSFTSEDLSTEHTITINKAASSLCKRIKLVRRELGDTSTVQMTRDSDKGWGMVMLEGEVEALEGALEQMDLVRTGSAGRAGKGSSAARKNSLAQSLDRLPGEQRQLEGGHASDEELWNRLEEQKDTLVRLNLALEEERWELESVTAVCAELENEAARLKLDLTRERKVRGKFQKDQSEEISSLKISLSLSESKRERLSSEIDELLDARDAAVERNIVQQRELERAKTELRLLHRELGRCSDNGDDHSGL